MLRHLLLAISFASLVVLPMWADLPRRAVIAAPAESQEAVASSADAVEDASPFRFSPIADGTATDAENNELAGLLTQYATSAKPYDFTWLDAYLTKYPDSAWKGVLCLNRGLIERYNGFIGASFKSFEQAWVSLKESEDLMLRGYANHALAELISIKAGLGRMDELEVLFAKTEGRRFHGKSAQLISSAREGLSSMEKFPERSFNCGPAALLNVLATLGDEAATDPRIMSKAATTDGLNLWQVSELAQEVGFNEHILAYRENGGIQLPAILHWKEGHFSALLRLENSRYLIKDPTLGNVMWVPEEAVDSEASGYFLLARSDVPEGWREVDSGEAEDIWGKGKATTYELGSTRPYDLKNCEENGNPGMPGHSVHLLALSVNVTDTPIWVNTPYGPSMHFTATYNQREISIPLTDQFGFMGLNWTHNWQSWIDANPGNGSIIPLAATRMVAGGGKEDFEINNGSTGYKPQRDTQADLVALFDGGNLDGFELNFPDGSKWVYQHEQAYMANSNARYFLTSITDPYGNAVTINYDSDDRIQSVDSGATTAVDLKFAYEFNGSGQPVWPSSASSDVEDNFIRAVIGPQGRYAEFDYNDDLMVKRVVDMAGMESTFSYKDVNSNVYIGAYATPYGTTVFDYPETNGTDDVVRGVVITDPEGQKERLEYNQVDFNFPGELVPSGTALGIHFYDDLNTYHWDKRAMETAVQTDGSVDYGEATIYHWMLATSQQASSVLHSIKRPLENREWLIYDDSPDGGATIGATNRPSANERYVKDESGATVLRTTGFEYNSLGNMTGSIDPRGRELEMNYAANGIDLLNVKQRTGAGANDFETLNSFDYDEDNDGNDDFPRLPSLIDGADGVRLDMTYNSEGQVTSAIRKEPDGSGGFTDKGTTDYTYYTTGDHIGFLEKIEGPSVGGSRATTTYTYDDYGRVETATDTDDFTLTYTYDDLNRIVKIDYPDGTHIANIYEPFSDGLDRIGFRDRMGRISQFRHDDLGRVVQSIDPKGQSTLYQWCGCGSLNALIDPKSQATTWQRDVQGRLTKKEYADGTRIDYAYEPESGFISKVTDQRGYEQEFKYFKDGNIEEISFDDGGTADPNYIDAPTLTYDYGDFTDPNDPNRYFNRIHSVTTAGDPDDYIYQYYGFTGDGNANRLQKVTISKQRGAQTVNNDIDYAYDDLGRLLTRSFRGDTETYNYDDLDRLNSLSDPLGDFIYSYDELTARILNVQHSVSSVNGIRTDLAYQSKIAGGEERKVPYLSSISHSNPSGTVSAHAYLRNENGWIDLWQQFDGSQWQSHSYRYDQQGQLQRDRKYDGLDENSPLLESEEYRYDLAGNRTLYKDGSAQLNDRHNNQLNQLNQLTARSSEGSVLFHGTISEPGKVFVQQLDGSNNVLTSTEAQLYGGNEFYASLDLPVGSNTVRIIATDIHGESTTQDYSVPVAADIGDSFTHDAAGNLTQWTKADGTVVKYKWDAANRLREILVDSVSIKTFEYDGSGRMVRATSGGQSDDYFWDGLERLGRENVDATPTVYRRYLTQGFTVSLDGATASNYYVLRDHLGSTREVLDGTYATVATYDYSAWGEVSKLSGTVDADQLYTGHLYFADTETPLHLAPYRSYQPELGRWLQRDFLGETGPDGPNVYAYTQNNPVNWFDGTGLWTSAHSAVAVAAAWGAGAGAFEGAVTSVAFQAIENAGNGDSCVNASGGIDGGRVLQDAVIGAGIGAITAGVGTKFQIFAKIANRLKGATNKFAPGASRLVNAPNAKIDPRKLTDYALNPNHPVGGNKAKVFESALGYNQSNAQGLLKQLQQGVLNNTPVAGKVDNFGSRFTVDIPVTGPGGSGTVRTGWIFKSGSNTPELTTLFVK
ncbi:MAG: DUF6883 domain-containing protein [Verrucomicrobiota bacterium]